jgi:hypothetical protein
MPGRVRALVAGALALLSAAPARGQERDYCPARPGLGTPACTIAPGRVSVETGLIGWTRDDGAESRTDTLMLGETLVRIGVTDMVEVQAEWTPRIRERVRDRTSGLATTRAGVGDLTLGLKANLRNPDGGGFAVAVQPFVSVPVAPPPGGAGDWAAGVLVPISWDLGGGLNAQLTPEADAAVDEDGHGRHLAYSVVMGLGFPLTRRLSGTVEYQVARDEDSGGATTKHLGSVSFGWLIRPSWQLDAGAVFGLNPAADDVQLYLGVSRRF